MIATFKAGLAVGDDIDGFRILGGAAVFPVLGADVDEEIFCDRAERAEKEWLFAIPPLLTGPRTTPCPEPVPVVLDGEDDMGDNGWPRVR